MEKTAPYPRPEQRNTCAIIVTYYPDSDFPIRLERIRSVVSATCIVDNGSEEIAAAAADLPGVTIIRNDTNRGIAAALNQGQEWAENAGFKWTLLFDQDTTPSPEIINTLSTAFDEYPDPTRLGMIGSHFNAEYQAISEGQNWVEVQTIINSGTLLSVEVFKRAGKFREDFFIDCVDFDYCLRLRSQGFKIIQVTSPNMEHSVGHETQHRVFGTTVRVSNHSPWRWYYMTRNNLILIRENILKNPRWAIKAIYSRVRGILLMLLFESCKLMKLRHIVAGAVDAMFSTKFLAPKVERFNISGGATHGRPIRTGC